MDLALGSGMAVATAAVRKYMSAEMTKRVNSGQPMQTCCPIKMNIKPQLRDITMFRVRVFLEFSFVKSVKRWQVTVLAMHDDTASHWSLIGQYFNKQNFDDDDWW